MFVPDRAMDHYLITDHDQNSMPIGSDPGPESDVPQNPASWSPQGSVSAAIAAVNAISGAAPGTAPALPFPHEDGSHSLAEMAQRDLDAALQLLAERAQYITEASGAAIALRRDAKNDMLCRASAGSNAPELGTLLSTEFGLSGESVRTRLPLRCDNADRDPRVNREGCRQLGIASVAVLPIISDDQVLGVFELFSGKINAFEERDLSALQRLGEMVETAVKLAHAAQNLPPEIFPDGEEEKGGQPGVEVPTEVAAASIPGEAAPGEVTSSASQPESFVKHSPAQSPPKTPVLWSAALHSSPAPLQQPAPDQSHVPLVLRNLHKCQACGFPVSEGRKLCVECEEKQWRGQLPVPRAALVQPANPATFAVPESVPTGAAETGVAASISISHVPPRADAALGLTPPAQVHGVGPGIPASVVSPAQLVASSPAMPLSPESAVVRPNPGGEQPLAKLSENPAGLLFQSSGESWFSANKYIIGSLGLVAIVIAIIALFR
jgi:hypothetical protein